MHSAPSDYKTMGTFMLVSGITNIGFGLLMTMTLLIVCVGVFYLAVVAVGIVEVIIGLGILQGRPRPTVTVVAVLGLVAGLFSMNAVSLVMQSLTLAWLSRPEIKAYLAAPGPPRTL